MAFKLHSVGSAKTAPIEFYPATADEAMLLGEALVLTSGTLTKCAATATPEFICVGARAATATTGLSTPVIRVIEDMIFEVATSADASSNAIGTVVTIDSTGLLVTATDTSGVFKLTSKVGTGNTGTKVRGMFRR